MTPDKDDVLKEAIEYLRVDLKRILENDGDFAFKSAFNTVIQAATECVELKRCFDEEVSAHGRLEDENAALREKLEIQEAATRKPPVTCSMAVDLTEWLYELFCESRSIDMQDVQDKMLDLGIIEGVEATEEDIDNGFDTNDIVFHKTEAYKKQGTPPVPADTIAVPREVLQGVRDAMQYYQYWHEHDINKHEISYNKIGEAIASLDAVLAKGK